MTRPGIYKHFKGGLYRVLCTAEECTNAHPGRDLVVYISLENGKVYCRDQDEFHEWMKHPADPGMMMPRFTMMEES